VILFLLFIVAPIAELYTIIQMSGAIGFFNTLGLMIAVGFIGSRWSDAKECAFGVDSTKRLLKGRFQQKRWLMGY
jgi:UPF0716 family protein affecting phage T7 exclusion